MSARLDLASELRALFEPLVEITERFVADGERALEREQRRRRDLAELQRVTSRRRR